MTTTESGYSDAGGQTGTYILGAQAEEETIRALTAQAVEDYVRQELGG